MILADMTFRDQIAELRRMSAVVVDCTSDEPVAIDTVLEDAAKILRLPVSRVRYALSFAADSEHLIDVDLHNGTVRRLP